MIRRSVVFQQHNWYKTVKPKHKHKIWKSDNLTISLSKMSDSGVGEEDSGQAEKKLKLDPDNLQPHQSSGRSPKNWSRSKIKIKWNDLQDQDQRSFLKWSCQIKIICMILADQDQDHGLSIYCDLDLFSERSPLLDQWKWSFRSRSFLQINKSDLCTQRSKIISKDLIFCTKDQWSSQALLDDDCLSERSSSSSQRSCWNGRNATWPWWKSILVSEILATFDNLCP